MSRASRLTIFVMYLSTLKPKAFAGSPYCSRKFNYTCNHLQSNLIWLHDPQERSVWPFRSALYLPCVSVHVATDLDLHCLFKCPLPGFCTMLCNISVRIASPRQKMSKFKNGHNTQTNRTWLYKKCENLKMPITLNGLASRDGNLHVG